jgi:hypothetical protein
VTAGCLGLPFERPQLAAHLAMQILQTHEVRLRRLDPALGPLSAPAELKDAGGLLDDGAAILGASLQHRVELALTHDDVLLAADPGI